MSAPITNREKMECARREVHQRRHVYPRLIDDGRMSRGRADRQIAVMEAIAEDYRQLTEHDEKEERLL